MPVIRRVCTLVVRDNRFSRRRRRVRITNEVADEGRCCHSSRRRVVVQVAVHLKCVTARGGPGVGYKGDEVVLVRAFVVCHIDLCRRVRGSSALVSAIVCDMSWHSICIIVNFFCCRGKK